MNLITDRTVADVELWQSLKAKGWRLMTAEEQQQWATELKGCYNYTDLNRVESAVEYLGELLRYAGYAFNPETKTDWTRSNHVTKQDMTRYLGNIANLREVISLEPSTPEAPTIEEKFDYQSANNIEKIIGDVNTLTEKMYECWTYSDEAYGGEIAAYWYPGRTPFVSPFLIDGALIPFGSTKALITADGAMFVCKEEET